MEDSKLLSTSEISKHSSPEDCWLVIDDQVWDCTKFAGEHPGGSSLILKYGGQDATKAYSEIHSPAIVTNTLSPECFKGNLDRSTITSEWRSNQEEPPLQEVPDNEKPPLHTILNANDFELASLKSSSAKTHAFYSTASTDCWTRDQNREMLSKIWFRPRILRNVTTIDTSSTILGHRVKLPIFISPSGLAKMIHTEGEKALGRAAKSSGILQVISSNASFPAGEILKQAPDYPFLFQLYVNRDRKKSEQLLQQVESQGLKAIFVTVDAAGRGKRESDERLRVMEFVTDPVTGEKKRGVGLTKIAGSYIDQGLVWEDIAWIRKFTKLPIILKGIQNAADARLAMEYGVEGIVVSNHGGRNLDYSPPSILLLLELHKQCPEIFDKMEIFIDGGFRRGGDILKALCLGARAVGLGRSFLFALGYGQEGAEQLVEILRDEMESAMKLLGIRSLEEVHSGLVNTKQVDWLVPEGEEHDYVKWRPKARI